MSEIRVDKIISHAGNSAPDFPQGANVTGVLTATSLSATNLSGSGANITSIPAGQLTGTVADARLSTVSSSKLSGALPALDASNLTGVKAEPTIDIVASGAIGAGKAVVVTSDGKAGIVTGTNIGFGDKNVFSTAGGSTWGYVAYDTANNRVVVAWRDQGAGKGYARVGTVTGTSISWGTAVEFTNIQPYYTNVIFNANTGKVVIIYQDSGDSNRGKCIIGTVSGTSISFGSVTQFTSANTGIVQMALFNIGNTNGFVIAHKADGNSNAIAATISGTTPTFGSTVEIYGNTWSYADGEWHTASETGVIVFYDAAGSIQVKCISVTGTTIDKDGDMVQLTTGNTSQSYPAIEYDPVNEKMMIAWMSVQESSSPERGSMIATGIPYSPGSGTKRSWRTQSVRAIEDVYGDYLSSTFDTVNNEMYIIYRGEAYQAARLVRARIISGDIDDPTGALGIGNTFGGYERVAVTTPVGFAGSYPMQYFSSMAFDPTGKKVFAMFPYYYDPASDNWSVWASSIQDSNLTSENFLGFSKSSYTDGQTATIKIAGAIDTSQVGLSTGKKYYMLPDASLTNTPSISGQFFNDPEGKYEYISAGIALSATNLIIKT